MSVSDVNNSHVIRYMGSENELVWKYPHDNISSDSVVEADGKHKVLLAVKENASDSLPEGVKKLYLPDFNGAGTALGNIISENSFCVEIYFVENLQRMHFLWGTLSPAEVNDPFFGIFTHIMSNGSTELTVTDEKKFINNFVKFRTGFTRQDFIRRSREIISSQVKNTVSDIMTGGLLSCSMLYENLDDLSIILKDRISVVMAEYGILTDSFTVNTVEMPDSDCEKIAAAENAMKNKIPGKCSWKEKRKALIAENPVDMNDALNMSGGSFREIASAALSPVVSVYPAGEEDFSGSFIKCPECGTDLPEKAKFCFRCGTPIEENSPDFIVCPGCGKRVPPTRFCIECGYKLVVTVCEECGAKVPEGASFCTECGCPV